MMRKLHVLLVLVSVAAPTPVETVVVGALDQAVPGYGESDAGRNVVCEDRGTPQSVGIGLPTGPLLSQSLGCNPFFIASSVPADGTVDPRDDMSLSGVTPQGFSDILITFNCRPVDPLTGGAPTQDNFWIKSTSSAGPVVLYVAPVGQSDTTFRVLLSGPIPSGEWTTLYTNVVGPTGVPLSEDADSVRLGLLPGDVDGSGRSSAADVLYMIDMLNGHVGNLNDLPSCDVDRSGACGAPDILRIIDLLNGAVTTRPWNNVALPPVPCDVDADCVDLNLCTFDVCSFGDCIHEDVDCGGRACDPAIGCIDSGDDDGDGVPNQLDLCPDTDAGAPVDGNGCAANQLDADRDGVTDDVDECPATPFGTRVDSVGCPVGSVDPVCGNGVIEIGEECEPPNTEVCSDTCTLIVGGTIDADACDSAGPILGAGAFAFDNSYATQDGPPHTDCVNVGEDNIDADVWACWTAPCTATVFVRTCGLTVVDTKIAVYDGCDCGALTDENLLSCNDDRCGLQSIATFSVQAGQLYLLRVGSFPGESGGAGGVQITCGLEACSVDSGACDEAHGGVGCSDVGCCETVCSIDSYCCDGKWDGVCVAEAAGMCSGSFATCAAGAGACTEANASAGCDDVDCCNTVCMTDPYCCLNDWDELCAMDEAAYCHSSCGEGAGDCFAEGGNGSPGCNSPSCCEEVCLRDPYCCTAGGEWDAGCAERAAGLCAP